MGFNSTSSRNWFLTGQDRVLTNDFSIISNIICSLAGIPLNTFVAYLILRYKRLHRRPRNIFLLGIIFANLLAFLPAVLETISYYGPAEEEASSAGPICKLLVATFGLPYVFLLLNLFLSLIDRYIAVTHPLWHREKVTVFRASLSLILGGFIVTFVTKFVYLSGMFPLTCKLPFIHTKSLGGTLVVLFILCVTAHFAVYTKTRKLLQDNRTIESSLTREISAPSGLAMMTTMTIQMEEQDQVRVHVTRSTLSRLEMEATQTLIAGVTSLLVLTFPLLVYFVVLFSCRSWYDQECPTVLNLSPYFVELWIIHAVFSPMMYLIRNSELASVM